MKNKAVYRAAPGFAWVCKIWCISLEYQSPWSWISFTSLNNFKSMFPLTIVILTKSFPNEKNYNHIIIPICIQISQMSNPFDNITPGSSLETLSYTLIFSLCPMYIERISVKWTKHGGHTDRQTDRRTDGPSNWQELKSI